jgi:hypothetical protein
MAALPDLDQPRRRPWVRARFEARSIAGKYPSIYLPIARRRRRGEPVSSDTALVIEGFPRSGNTFCAAAFGSAQTRPVRVARHEHVPAQVIAAARADIPTLVLIRGPEDAVLSLVIQHPEVTVRQATRAYVRFYQPLLRFRGRFLVATFDELVADLGAVIDRLNAKFGTGFDVFQHTKENVARCLAEIEEQNRTVWGDESLLQRKGAFPSEQRTALKVALRGEFRKLGRIASKAQRLFEALAADRATDPLAKD